MTKQKYTKPESTVVPMASVKLLDNSNPEPEPIVDPEQPGGDPPLS